MGSQINKIFYLQAVGSLRGVEMGSGPEVLNKRAQQALTVQVNMATVTLNGCDMLC